MMPVPYFDAHCDTITAQGYLRVTNGHLDLTRLQAYAPCAQVFAICCTEDMPGGYQEYFPLLLRQLEENRDMVKLCRCADDIRSAAEEGKIAALIAAEGAEHFGCSLDGLRDAYDRGVRSVNITWNHDNALSGAAMDSGRGLTAQGRAFAREAQRLGVILDVSHLSDRGFWDLLEISEKPIYASHSNAHAICPWPRNLKDEQFTALAERGGGAGLNLCADFLGLGRDIDAIVAHLEHFLSLGGEKAVFLGTDFDGIDETPAGIRGVEDMQTLYNTLLRRNYPEALVNDIFYNNLLSIMERAL